MRAAGIVNISTSVESDAGTVSTMRKLQPFANASKSALPGRAVRTIGSAAIIHGHFLTKRTHLPELASLDAISAQQRAGVKTRGMTPAMTHVYRSEEEAMDVNLAIHLVHAAYIGSFDAAIVVSNDSDLAGMVRIVRRKIGKPVFVIHPPSLHPSFQLEQVATRFHQITRNHLSSSQLLLTLTDANETFREPSTR